MWLAGTWLSLCTCLCTEETPGLITPTPDTLRLPGSFFSLPFPSFFPLFLLCPCTSAAPSPSIQAKGNTFFPFCRFHFEIHLIFFISVFFFYPSCALLCSLLVCNWLFFCLSSLSFTRFISHSFSDCPLSRSLPFLGSLPSTPFFFSPYVHVFKAVFLWACVSLSVWQVLNIHMHFCAWSAVSHAAGSSVLN